MVNAINTTQSIYAPSIQYSTGSENYSSLSSEGIPNSANNSEVTDKSIVSDAIVEQQNEIFSIQINTQCGISLINTAQSAVDDMQEVVKKLKEKLATLSSASTVEELSLAQGEIDELLDELYDYKNGAKYDGVLIFGEYDEKPSRLSDSNDPNRDSRYMESAAYQIGFSTSQNSYLEFDTVFKMGNFDIRVTTPDAVGSAKSVCEAFEKDLNEYEKNLNTNKELLVQNNQSSSEYMKQLISYEGVSEISDGIYISKSLAELRMDIVLTDISKMFGFSEGKLTQIMSGVWGI